MGLSGSNTKKFLIFWEMETLNRFLIFSENKAFLTLILKNLIFLQRKLSLYFRKWKPQIKFLILQETELSYIFGNIYFKKLLIFQILSL